VLNQRNGKKKKSWLMSPSLMTDEEKLSHTEKIQRRMHEAREMD